MREQRVGRLWIRSRRARWSAVARGLPLLLVAALLLQNVTATLADQQGGSTEDVVVVFPHLVEASALGVLSKFNIEPTQRYTHVVDGFAATVTPDVRQQLEQIPGAIVSPDRRVEAFDDHSASANGQGKANGGGKHATGEGKHKHKHKHKKKHKKKNKNKNKNKKPVQPQIIPTGVSRIAATQNPQTGINGDGGAIDVD